MHPLICVVIKGPSIDEVKQQLHVASKNADLVEWRLDWFNFLDYKKLESLVPICPLPSIFTLRPEREGGGFRGSESERLQTFEQLLMLLPAYVDIEWNVERTFIENIRKKIPATRLILSYHHFSTAFKPNLLPMNGSDSNPTAFIGSKLGFNDLESILQKMKKVPADYYKIATMSDSALDALKIMEFAKGRSEPLIAIAMGEKGQTSRIAGPLAGISMAYASIESSTNSLGQLSAKELAEVYRYKNLNTESQLFGLIGNPVDKSPGHLTHNAVFAYHGINALYVKIPIDESEIGDFFTLGSSFFTGLSVTMPLKEAIMPYLKYVDQEAREIGAVNTLVFRENEAFGYNTDGMGALNALEAYGSVLHKRLIIIGAGGTARAIAYEAKKRGAEVYICNRNQDKAKILAKDFDCFWSGLDGIKQMANRGYDILVNATPESMPIEPEAILAGTMAMDVKSNPASTDFLKAAFEKGCHIISGYEMFIEQAVGQFRHWFGDRLDSEKVREIIRLQEKQEPFKCIFKSQ